MKNKSIVKSFQFLSDMVRKIVTILIVANLVHCATAGALYLGKVEKTNTHYTIGEIQTIENDGTQFRIIWSESKSKKWAYSNRSETTELVHARCFRTEPRTAFMIHSESGKPCPDQKLPEVRWSEISEFQNFILVPEYGIRILLPANKYHMGPYHFVPYSKNQNQFKVVEARIANSCSGNIYLKLDTGNWVELDREYIHEPDRAFVWKSGDLNPKTKHCFASSEKIKFEPWRPDPRYTILVVPNSRTQEHGIVVSYYKILADPQIVANPMVVRPSDFSKTKGFNYGYVFFPITLPIDIVTAPIQMIILGFDRYLLFSACILGIKCANPLG